MNDAISNQSDFERQQEDHDQAMMRHSVSITGVADFETSFQVDLGSHGHHVIGGRVVGHHDAKKTATEIKKEDWVNITSAGSGSMVLFATDEWFATADNLLRDDPPVFDETAYCLQGKVMDGWETRRRREAGHDWCIIKLATPPQQVLSTPTKAYRFVAVEVDTAYFTGNHVPAISIQIANIEEQKEVSLVSNLPQAMERILRNGRGVQGTGMTPAEIRHAEEVVANTVGVDGWNELLPKTKLQPGYETSRLHYFPIDDKHQELTGTHIRVNYYPDGGVARLRIWGKEQHSVEDVQTWSSIVEERPPKMYLPITTGSRCTVVCHGDVIDEKDLPSRHSLIIHDDNNNKKRKERMMVDLSSIEVGGVGISCSNEHYGIPRNLIQSSLGRDMGDGWETARHPNRPSVWLLNEETNLLDCTLSDFCIIKLGRRATSGIRRIILDTKHFRGNYPESVLVEGCCCSDEEEEEEDGVSDDDYVFEHKKEVWFVLIDRCRMSPDAEHVFDMTKDQIRNANVVGISHMRITIFPDGGISRVRVYG